jgi:hypothetical protein
MLFTARLLSINIKFLVKFIHVITSNSILLLYNTPLTLFDGHLSHFNFLLL